MARYIHRKAGRETGARPGAVLALFLFLLVGFSVLNFFWPKRDMSDLENRKLAQLPSFSIKTLLNGDFLQDFSTYMQDQVAFRDTWIDLESAFNNLAFGKVEESNILLGKDGWMFTKLFDVSPDTQKQLSKNLDAVTNFASRHPGKVTFLLAPSASVIYPEKLPVGAPMVDENAMLDDIFSQVSSSADVLDLRDVFTREKDEYLYYKTDHHWTTQGAYLAYQQFCQLKGLTPFDTAARESVSIPDFYGTHYSAARRWDVQPDVITYYPLDNPMTIYDITGETQYSARKTETMVNTEKFQTRDKYAAFLDGNNGYSVIEGNGEGSILVVKDSYANCFVPFLTENYAKIGVVDLRNFSYGLDSTIESEGYDQVLILYNFQTFIADNRVVYLDRPTTLTSAE
ncbi:DHHW family protein [uncultured Gemmiger sp.]|uniref:DHHW family protein n=1 Tax=uncultured Gemmiger sp. TaxID=1623490 RepID=UPI0025F4D187|nr:DHHW family protein [uncultured Gemmiger sp.]